MDTPEEKVIEKEIVSKEFRKDLLCQKVSGMAHTGESLKKENKRRTRPVMWSDDWCCSVCVEPYFESRTRGVGVQTLGCKNRSFVESTDVLKTPSVYLCHK